MNMKEHILMALKEQFNLLEELLGMMSIEQINAPHLPSHWSTKDEIAHLWAWQQRSIARLQAAGLGRAPEYPVWLPGLDPDAEGGVERANDWIYESQREKPWANVHAEWRAGFLRFLELGEPILEKDLLDGDRYPWLAGYPLANVYLASYDHHQEHIDGLLVWLAHHGK